MIVRYQKKCQRRRMNIACYLLGALLSIIYLTIPCVSSAGGLYLNEFGTPSMGVAGAGANAVANDASTSFHNAAGMTRIKGIPLAISSLKASFLYSFHKGARSLACRVGFPCQMGVSAHPTRDGSRRYRLPAPGLLSLKTVPPLAMPSKISSIRSPFSG